MHNWLLCTVHVFQLCKMTVMKLVILIDDGFQQVAFLRITAPNIWGIRINIILFVHEIVWSFYLDMACIQASLMCTEAPMCGTYLGNNRIYKRVVNMFIKELYPYGPLWLVSLRVSSTPSTVTLTTLNSGCYTWNGKTLAMQDECWFRLWVSRWDLNVDLKYSNTAL